MSKPKKNYVSKSKTEAHSAATKLGSHGGRAKRRWRWEKKPITAKQARPPRRRRSRSRTR